MTLQRQSLRRWCYDTSCLSLWQLDINPHQHDVPESVAAKHAIASETSKQTCTISLYKYIISQSFIHVVFVSTRAITSNTNDKSP